MDHLMVDLETLGIGHDAVVLSIAAVQFDLNTGVIGNTFYMNIDLDSSLKVGFKVGASTLKWWMTQRSDVMLKMFEDPHPITEVLMEFSKFCNVNRIKYLWGNSAAFDLGKLSYHYNVCQLPQPWKYQFERCYRTMVQNMAELLNVDLSSFKKPTNVHDPVADCLYQIHVLSALYITAM